MCVKLSQNDKIHGNIVMVMETLKMMILPEIYDFRDLEGSWNIYPDAKNKSIAGEMDVTTQERSVALRFRAWRSCLLHTKRGPNGFLAFEFKNSSHLGQHLSILAGSILGKPEHQALSG